MLASAHATVKSEIAIAMLDEINWAISWNQSEINWNRRGVKKRTRKLDEEGCGGWLWSKTVEEDRGNVREKADAESVQDDFCNQQIL